MANPGNATRLDDPDALIWAVERDPRLASTISSIVVFDSPVDVDALTVRLERTTRVVPRLRQRVVGNPVSLSPPRWEFDPDFDLTNHLDIDEAPHTMRSALDLAGPFIDSPFDRDRPLWKFVLLRDFEGGSALVMKAHHAIADGMGMLAIQLELFDFEPDTGPPELPPPVQADPLSAAERLTNALEFERDRTVKAARELAGALLGSVLAEGDPVDRLIDTVASAAMAAKPVTPLSPLLTARSANSWRDTIALSLPGLKAAATRAGTRLNPVFVAGVARGLGRFHAEMGEPCERLRMGMPVNIRGAADDSTTGNRIVPIRLEVPLDADEPDHLIQIVAALVDAQRNDPAQSVLGPAQQLLARLPAPVAGLAFAQVLRGSDFLTSNLVGSPVPMWIADSQVSAQYPFGPTSAAAVNVTLLSYLDEAHVGVSIDAQATEHPDRLAECLRDGFDWVLAG